MAEVVLRARLREAGLASKVVTDSAGTGDWHVGDQMNPPAEDELARRGYDGSAHRARQFEARWLAERDLILAMDHGNLDILRAAARRAAARRGGEGTGAEQRIRLFGDVTGLDGADVPDPYGGGAAEFARVLDMLEAGTERLVAQLRAVVEAPAGDR